MRVPHHSALRGLRPAQPPAVESPIDTRTAVLYLPSTARDRMVIRDRLSRTGATVSLATDIPEALRMLGARAYGLIVVDLAGGEQAVATVRLLRAQSPTIPVAGVMDPSEPLNAAEALNAGAIDVLPWPFEERDILSVFTTARDRRAVDVDFSCDVDDRLHIHSPAMRTVADAVRAATSRKMGMLLVGAPGTGRTVVARTRHLLDDEYVNRPFVTVECDASGGGDLEGRLFGAHENAEGNAQPSAEPVARGAAILAAQGGTLFLKNLASAPARVQARLAGILRDREVLSVEVNEIVPVDVRVIAAAGPDVDGAVADGRLRRDLFERVAGVRIDVPPFQRRREDLPLLAVQFLQQACDADRIGAKRFSRAALAVIAAMPWRGNAPEMAEAIAAIARSTRQSVIQLDDVLDQVSLHATNEGADETLTLRQARARFEREFISRALARHHGRVGEAAQHLGIQRTNLYRKVRQLKVPKSLLSTHR